MEAHSCIITLQWGLEQYPSVFIKDYVQSPELESSSVAIEFAINLRKNVKCFKLWGF